MINVKSGRQSIATELHLESLQTATEMHQNLYNMCDTVITKMNGMLTQYAWSQKTVPKFPATKNSRIHHMLGEQKVYMRRYATLQAEQLA